MESSGTQWNPVESMWIMWGMVKYWSMESIPHFMDSILKKYGVHPPVHGIHLPLHAFHLKKVWSPSPIPWIPSGISGIHPPFHGFHMDYPGEGKVQPSPLTLIPKSGVCQHHDWENGDKDEERIVCEDKMGWENAECWGFISQSLCIIYVWGQ